MATKKTAKRKTAKQVVEPTTVSLANLSPLRDEYKEADNSLTIGFTGYAKAVGHIVETLENLRRDATKKERDDHPLYDLVTKVTGFSSRRTIAQIIRLGRAVYKNTDWERLFAEFGIQSREAMAEYFTAKGLVKANKPPTAVIEISYVTPSGSEQTMTISYETADSDEETRRNKKSAFADYLSKVKASVKLAESKKKALMAVQGEYA